MAQRWVFATRGLQLAAIHHNERNRVSAASFVLAIAHRGENVRAAKYARFPYERLVIISMILSGAFAGWAGWIEASATLNRLQPTIMVGYGYTAIVVAWLARLNPLYIGISSFLLAGLRVGVENLQLELQIPAAFGEIMEGLILLTILAGTFFVNYRFERRRGA